MSNWSDADVRFMTLALELAQQAATENEVPVGAVLVQNDEVLGTGRNRPIALRDATAHAEMEAIRGGCRSVKNYRLTGSTLYVSLEPCLMCAGAIVNARVSRLVFAARDLRFGAIRSRFRVADSDLMNHRAKVEEGLLAADAGALLQAFFAQRRSMKSGR